MHLFAGCIAQQSGSSSRNVSELINDPSKVGAYQSYVMTENPVVKSGGAKLNMGISLGAFLDPLPQFITSQQILSDSLTIDDPNSTGSLYLSNVKYDVRQTSNSTYLAPNQGTWAYDANSDQFQEVNTFYLLTKEIKFFQEALWNQNSLNMVNSSMPANFSISAWPYSINSDASRTPLSLSAYTKGMDEKNAQFSPTNFELRFGKDTELSGTYLNSLYFSQDPSVLFHEAGHAMVHIMMNTRNLAQGNILSTRLGYRFYDEAGSINEGLADYFSYALTGHTHFADWALGNFYNASRPISEADPLHAAGISEDSNERLRYPDFLNYDPNEPTKLYEDIHQAGMTASHYLVALTKDLQSKCSFSHETSSKYVLGLLSETMAQLGDLEAKGIDGKVDFVNLNSDNALEWIQTANPINYRSFFQTFAFKLNALRNHFAIWNVCNNLSQDDVEKLLDDYGLLLFKSYNDDGNSTAANTTTQVNPLNQQKSSLVLKKYINLDPTPDATVAYVFDKRESIANTIKAFVANGELSPVTDLASTSLIPDDYSYNNANGLISPGELVGVSLNLYNSSNSSIAGVQILANDWDHAKDGKPCRKFENGIEDTWPTDSEGAADTSAEAGVAGDCTHTTRDNSQTAPVCFLQLNETNSTQWVSQEKFRADRGLEPKNCLGGEGNTNDCYIRAVNHLNTSFYSKIDSNKTWIQTITAANQPLTFHASNLIFFEVNPWVPPGTKVNCRLRARFTNCEDCYNHTKDSQNDNYDDYEYSGAAPFKLINFQFTVID